MTALSRAAMALMLVSAVGCNDGPVDEIVADAALDATVDGDLPDAEAMDMEIPPEDAAPPRPDARPRWPARVLGYAGRDRHRASARRG